MSHNILVGSRGGIYYVNKNNNKIYIKPDTKNCSEGTSIDSVKPGINPSKTPEVNRLHFKFIEDSKKLLPDKKDSSVVKAPLVVGRSCGSKWNILNKQSLGEGEFGSVVVACDKNEDISPDCQYVVKIQPFESTEYNDSKTRKKVFLNEVSLLSKLRGSGIVPMIYDAWICNNIGYTVMERLSRPERGKLNSYYVATKKVLKRLHDHGIVMLDFHLDNFMLKNGQPILIDLGLGEDYSTVSPGQTIHHASAIHYGDFTFEQATEFDNLTVDLKLGKKKIANKARKRLIEMEI